MNLEFRDVPCYLDPLLSSTSAVGSKWSCSAPNVTPMRPPKRNTLTFTVAVRSIPKCIWSIKIDISEKTGQISFSNSKPKVHCGDVQISTNLHNLCYHRSGLRCIVSNINQLVSIHNSKTIFCGQFRNWDWPFNAVSFPKKIYTTEAAMYDGRWQNAEPYYMEYPMECLKWSTPKNLVLVK